MSYRFWMIVCLAVGISLSGASEGRLAGRQAKADKEEKAPPKGRDVNLISLEVKALASLHALQATPAQLKALQALFKEQFVKATKRQPAEVGAGLRKNLGLLRQALIRNEEEDIKIYTNKVEVLGEDEEIDDDVEVTRASALAAREALSLFTPRQILSRLSVYKDNFPEPTVMLLDTLEDGVNAKAEDWQSARDNAAFQVGWLAGGLYTKTAEKIAADATKWLDAKHALTADDLRKQRAKLQKEAREEFMPRLNPLAVLANISWHDLAELLCNPQFPAVLKARLDFEAKAAK